MLNKSDFTSLVKYNAADSIYSDFDAQQLHLYGKAFLSYEGISMNAGYILVDFGKNEVLATYSKDTTTFKEGKPTFVENGDTMRAGSIRYNFQTKKGYIQELALKQQEYYLSMETAKRQANEEIHFVKGKFTTCSLEEPHYHFQLSKAILVPEKRIVTGPMNLWVLGVPTPIGLPFSILPQQKPTIKPNGVLMPQFSIISIYGMGVQDLGFYQPINEKIQTTLYGTFYSRGTFGFRNKTDYNVRYKFKGGIDLGYTRFRLGWPNKTPINAFVVKWNHTQDAKANPNWTFNASVNFNSRSTNKVTLNLQNTEQYFENNLNSDIRLGRRFSAKPISADLKLSMRQNSVSKLIDLTSPVLNFQTTSRIFPFKSINKIIGMTYAGEFQSRSSFKDSYISNKAFDSIAQQFRTGANHRLNMQATFSLLNGAIRFSPSANYNQTFNFQSIVKSVDTNNQLQVDTLNSGGLEHVFNSSASITSTLYSYYRFIGKRKTVLRHVMTPTISINYSPAIQLGIANYTDTAGNVFNYSRFERSIYSSGIGSSNGRISIGINNSLELKQKSNKDTITGYKKTRIIDNLYISTDYDIFKDTMNWNDVAFRMVINPIETFNITINGAHSLYAWNTTTGVSNALYAFETNQGIGRLKSGSISTSWTFTAKKNRAQLKNSSSNALNTWNPNYQQWINSPTQLILFDIPWKISVEHIFSLASNFNQATFVSKNYLPTNTLRLSGDLSFTENWKVASNLLLDLESGKITNFNINMFRNIHCWNVSFNWTPIGTNKNFVISLRGTAAALQNVNLNIRRPPVVF
uniref:putative LPS assembly protein LptD n=1 Tax=Fluviicola sp. TaxID=1917219 RepID=UPI0040494631